MKAFYFLFCLYFLYCFYNSNNKITLFYKWINITAIFICHYNSKGSIIGIFPILLSSPFTSCSLINLGFLLLQTAQFDESISFPFFVFSTLGFLLSVFFYTSNNTITLFYKETRIFDEFFKSFKTVYELINCLKPIYEPFKSTKTNSL